MFRFSKRGCVEYLESAALSEWGFLDHAFCTRRNGVSEGQFASLNVSVREGDGGGNVRQNWEIIADAFNLRAEQFFVVHQVHGDNILVVDRTNIGDFKQRQHRADAIITNLPGLAIGIKTADCVPVFMADREKRIIGVVHAGWRGTALNIAAKTVKAFTKAFSSRPEDIVAVIGPAIGPCCYEVDETVFNAMTMNGDWESSFTPCGELGKWMLNLASVNTCQMIQAGIRPDNVLSSCVCTSCRKDLFFSHRGEEGRTGRQVNFMMLKQNRSL
jgi:YfiH family protein